MSLRTHQFRKPTVYVTKSEYERLWNLAESRNTAGARFLGDELVRAIVIGDDDPRAFVRLNSRVEFTDRTTGRTRRVELVAPDEADIDADRLSVLTPVGAGLIGLRPGDSIGITTEDGRPHVLAIVSVEDAHAAA